MLNQTYNMNKKKMPDCQWIDPFVNTLIVLLLLMHMRYVYQSNIRFSCNQCVYIGTYNNAIEYERSLQLIITIMTVDLNQIKLFIKKL